LVSLQRHSIFNANDFLDSSEDEETPLPGPDKPHEVLALLRKWLDLDTPELSEKMVDFLLQDGRDLPFPFPFFSFFFFFFFFFSSFFPPFDTSCDPHFSGVLETLLDQIILMDKNVKIPASYKSGAELPYRSRDYSNQAALKRSYNAMEILSGNSKSLARLLQPKFRQIGAVNSLFHPNFRARY